MWYSITYIYDIDIVDDIHICTALILFIKQQLIAMVNRKGKLKVHFSGE